MRVRRDGAVRWLLTAACVTTVLALVSCNSSAGPGSASGGTPGAAVSSATPAVDASVDAQAQASASQAALYAEAEGVYRAFFAEHRVVLINGGAEELPPQVASYVMGEYEIALTRVYQKLQELNSRSKPGTSVKLSAIAPYTATPVDDSLVILAACIDGRDSPMVLADGSEYPGGINFDILYFRKDSDGSLKIFTGRDEVVGRCPIG